MSSTVPIEHGDAQFWAFDVSLSILFAEMAAEPSEWDKRLRVHAIVGASFAVPLDEWTDGREAEFIALIRIIEGTCPPPPEGHLWHLGNEDPNATLATP